MRRIERQRRAQTGRRASLRRSAGTPTSFRCSVSWPVAELTSLTSFRYVQTGGDKSVYEARCARGPRALCSSAPKRRPPTCPGTPLRNRCWCSAEEPTRSRCGSRLLLSVASYPAAAARQAVPGRGDFWGDEQRRAGGRRACALQVLTRRGCLNEAERSERSEFCGATPRPSSAVQSAVLRRPPQHEALLGTACRAAQTPRKIGPFAGESGAPAC